MNNNGQNGDNNRVTAAEILKEVPITRKTLWLWQKKYQFFPDPSKEGHPSGKGIVGYYPSWVRDRCKKVYSLQKSGYTITMIQDFLRKEAEEKSAKKILVVDDEKKFTILLQKFLVKSGYQVEVAYNGLDAGLKAAQFQPSIILLDINLPGLNGLEVCKTLKANPRTQNTSVIIISASLNYSEQEILDSGAEMFVQKPLDLTDLLEKCKIIQQREGVEI